MKTLCSVKAAGHKRPHIIWFHLYDMSRIGKSKETENWFMIARVIERENGVVIATGYRVSFPGGESVLELGRGGGCIPWWMSLYCSLSNALCSVNLTSTQRYTYKYNNTYKGCEHSMSQHAVSI